MSTEKLYEKPDPRDVEIAELKAELAAYIELGTPDEFAKALTAANKTNYPKILDKYREARKVITEKQGEIIKLRAAIDLFNEVAEEVGCKGSDEDKLFAILADNARLRETNELTERKVSEVEKKLKNRNRVCQGRKERIEQLKAANRRLEKMLLEYARELGKYEGDKQG